MKGEYKEYEGKMKKTIEVIGQEFATIRAGRANPAVLDRITVEYYGTQTPIGQVASISSPEPRALVIQPWDGSILKAKAYRRLTIMQFVFTLGYIVLTNGVVYCLSYNAGLSEAL